MAELQTNGVTIHFDTYGKVENPPLLMIAGLPGVGAAFGNQIKRFSENFFVIVPDHRGAGKSSRPTDGYTILEHARDMNGLLTHLKVGPAHILGFSGGGAISQVMALEFPSSVRTLTFAAAYANPDAFFIREFLLRRKLLAEVDRKTFFEFTSLFVFSPAFMRDNPDFVTSWVERMSSQPIETEIAQKRTDMALAHNMVAKLPLIQHPSLVICGDQDFCCPIGHSKEIAEQIPNSQFIVMEGAGHFLFVEKEDAFYENVVAFLRRNLK